MNQRRVLGNCLPFTPLVANGDDVEDPKVYAIGGSFDGSCEAFNLNTGKWNLVSGFERILRDNDLQSFSVCLV